VQAGSLALRVAQVDGDYSVSGSAIAAAAMAMILT
jgi:hypothetical protein